jgi:hypothetical protein
MTDTLKPSADAGRGGKLDTDDLAEWLHQDASETDERWIARLRAYFAEERHGLAD